VRRCLELRRICLVQHNSGQENVSEEEVMVLYVTAALYPYLVPKIGLTKLGACDRLRDYVMRPDIQVLQLSGIIDGSSVPRFLIWFWSSG
jgi:hypothetical protein